MKIGAGVNMKAVAVLIMATGGFAVAAIAVYQEYTGTAVTVAGMVAYVTYRLLGDER